ncbi:MAG: ATP-grasp domain-containing protein [Bacteroidetes bacterium]|nr:ATP-grasp domain-containing protein [Bacteroidota bacterium]MBU1719957.1 ATP-grasp domain-containing protein [Bacteroidota bacterium]
MKKLIIIGANNFQLPLIVKAKEMDLETHVFAWEEGAIGKDVADYFYPFSIIEKDKILVKASEIHPDGIISIGSDLAINTVNYIADKLNLTGNTLACTENTTNKYVMRKILSAANLPCPKFSANTNADEVIRSGLHYPLIVKPTDRSGSRGVSKVNTMTELEHSIERALTESFNKQIIIEEFIQGHEYSIEMISWKSDHTFLQITDKETSGAPYFVEKEQHQPSGLPDEIKVKLISIIKKSLSVLGVEFGASHSEVIITDAGDIYITEIGARMGGDYIGSDLVQLSTGFDFVKAVIEVSLGIQPEIKLTEENYSGVYYVFPNPGVVVDIIDNTQEYSEIVRSEIYVQKGSKVAEIRESNQRAACFIYKSKSQKFLPEKDTLSLNTQQ